MQILNFDCFEARNGNPEVRAIRLASQAWKESAQFGDEFSCFCVACKKTISVQVSHTMNLREGFRCPECSLNARVRALISVLGEGIGGQRVYVTEQATSMFVWLQNNCSFLRGSEFEPNKSARARLEVQLHSLGGKGGVEFQDVTNLSFDSNSFDTVISLDVLEHVPNYRAALSEFSRILVSGGRLVATFPFNDRLETVTLATIAADGEITHLQEPEYHGDPISGGVLCYYHFGWDTLTAVREAGFSDAKMVLVWAPEQALYFGHWVLIATK